MKNNKKSFAGFGLLTLSQTMVGVNIVGSKFLIASTPIFFLLTMRFLLACIFLLPFHWLSSDGKTSIINHCQSISRRDWLLILLQALCAGALFNLLMVLGLRYTDAHVAGIITSCLPALIAVGCWLFLKEKFTTKKTICVSFATLGLIVIGAGKMGNTQVASSILGNLLVFFALIPEASYYVLTKLQSKRLPIFLMSAVINAINAVVLLPLMLLHHDYQLLHITFLDFLILAMVSMSSGLFYVFWYLGAEKVDMLMASLATAIMPISTVIIAWLTLGETIDWPELAGMILVIFSIIAYAI